MRGPAPAWKIGMEQLFQSVFLGARASLPSTASARGRSAVTSNMVSDAKEAACPGCEY